MGNEVLYCAGCQTRLLASEFEKQKAFKIDAQAWCAPCAKERFPGRTRDTGPREKPPLLPAEAPKFSSSTRVSIHKTPRRGTPAAGPPMGLILAGAAGAMLVLLLLFVAAGGSKPVAPRPAPPPETIPPPPPAVTKEPGSSVRPPPPAPPEPAVDVRRQTLAALEKELGTLDGEVAAELRTQTFAAAVRRLNAARGRHAEAEWTLAVDRRLQDVVSQARQALQPLLTEAAAQRANAGSVDALRKRVAAWEIPSLVEELDAALAAAAPPPPAPPPKPPSAPLDGRWKDALGHAIVRDYAAAAAALDATAEAVSDPKLKRLCAEDAALLRKIDALHREALQAVVQLPKGSDLSLLVYDEPRRREVKGKVERILDGSTIELADGRRVEAGELSTPSLMAILRLVRKGDLDPMAASVYSLLDSQTGEAKKLIGQVKVPERFWKFGEYSPPPDAEPRAAFEKADALSRDPAKAVEAAAAFRALLTDHGTTAFVRRNRAAIERRSGLPKEVFFGPDRVQGGRLERHAKAGAVRVGGPLDLVFPTEPNATWRAWVYVGGCCAEALAFSWQVADMTEPAAVKPQIYAPQKTHAQHGGVKEATRWGWVSLPLPAFPAAGAKTLRLLPSGEGFTLAHAMVSSVRTVAPSEAEVKALRVDVPEAELSRPSEDPSLVGWWRFDEGGGTVLRDATRNGNHGRIAGARWAKGVSGGALSFDGQDDVVIVPPSPSLDGCARAFTFSAWVFRSAPQDGWRVVACRQRGSSYQDQWCVAFDGGRAAICTFAPDGRRNEAGKPEVAVGRWMHVAATRDEQALRLYVDGAQAGAVDGPLELTPEARPLTFGAGQNEANDSLQEHLHGLLDEIRIYSRALSAAEIRALAGR